MMQPPFEKASSLAAVSAIRHGFFGRRCGNGSADSDLNTSETLGDDPDRIAANRHLAAQAIGAGAMPMASLRQIHSAEVVTLTAPLRPDARPQADGLVTATPGIALSILTADCAPLLFCDAEAGVIGACHAGWKGAVGGIVGNTIDAMTSLGARKSRIIAAIGPTISGANYEVGPDFAADLVAQDKTAGPHIFRPKGEEREHFDLPGYLISGLDRAGIGRTEIASGCTYADPVRYFSHRHSTHHGTPEGRQISLIALS